MTISETNPSGNKNISHTCCGSREYRSAIRRICFTLNCCRPFQMVEKLGTDIPRYAARSLFRSPWATMKDFNFSLSNILFHSLLKDNRGALQFGCAGKLQKTQDKVYAIIGYAFLAGGRVQGLRGRLESDPDLQAFTLKTRETCRTSSTVLFI